MGPHNLLKNRNEAICKMYVIDKEEIKDIAGVFELGQHMIRKILLDAGVKLRNGYNKSIELPDRKRISVKRLPCGIAVGKMDFFNAGFDSCSGWSCYHAAQGRCKAFKNYRERHPVKQLTGKNIKTRPYQAHAQGGGRKLGD